MSRRRIKAISNNIINIPSKFRYKRTHKVLSFKGLRGTTLRKPRLKRQYAIIATQSGFMSYQQIEAIRKKVTRPLKNRADWKICVFPTYSKTKKPLQVRRVKVRVIRING
jgi:ribosomal protein L16/L10AE